MLSMDDFINLGTQFNGNNSFNEAIMKQVNQAMRALYGLQSKYKRFSLPADICIHLFNQTIVPILMYEAEIWGIENVDVIDIFYRNFLKLKTPSWH